MNKDTRSSNELKNDLLTNIRVWLESDNSNTIHHADIDIVLSDINRTMEDYHNKRMIEYHEMGQV